MEPRHGATYAQILALAQATDDAGFDAFFRSDHLFGVDPNDPTYRPTDCWTTLAGLARDTSRIRLGALVTAATFRLPGLLATIVAGVDEMSGGRVELGLGTGWYQREHEAFGIPFPPTRERFDRLAEQLEIITGLWGVEPGSGPAAAFSFAGEHYRVEANHTPPRPAQRPHPPIIVGGTGPKRTPAIAARFADEFNGALSDDLREGFARFDRACERIGRDPATARRSAVLPVACATTPGEVTRRARVIGSELIRRHAVIGSPALVADRVAELRKCGADTIYFHIYDIEDLDHVALLGAEVLREMGDHR
jgi:F420-dependent oxidoreductase-like protein